MARKKENLGVMDGFFDTEPVQQEPEPTKKGYNPESLKNLHPRKIKSPKPKAFMQVNVYEYEDYLYRMSKVRNKAMSEYILDLIKSDKERNQQLYDGLKDIKELDKPARVPRNKKKSAE